VALLVGCAGDHRQVRPRLGLRARAGPPRTAADAEPARLRAIDRPRGARPRRAPARRDGVRRGGTVTDRGERYLPEHLHQALLADERVGEQTLDVWADEHCIHIAGSVATTARRDAILSVVNELAPGWD